MQSKKVSKLLPYPGVRSRRFYRLEREEVIKFHVFPRLITELAAMRSYENMAKTDMVLLSSEAEELEAAARFIMEATS